MSVLSVAPRRAQETSMVMARLRLQIECWSTLWQAPEIVKGQGRDGVVCSRAVR